MTKEIVFKMIQIIKKNYNYAYKDLTPADIEELVDFWYDCLKDYDKQVVAVAFRQTIIECKMPPALADIIEHIKELQNAGMGNDAELWNILDTARQKVASKCGSFDWDTYITRDGDDIIRIYPMQELEKIYNELPIELQEWVGGKQGLKSLSYINDETSLSVEKARFMKTIGQTKKNIEIKKEFPQIVAKYTEKLTNGKVAKIENKKEYYA